MAHAGLIVDDERDIRELVAGELEDEGYQARSAADSDAALAAIDERRPSLVLLDVWLQGSRLDGLDLLAEIKRRDPSLPVLVISGHGNIDTAVAAIRKTSSRSRSRPNACCCSSRAPPRPSGSSARTPRCARRSARRTS